MTRFGLLFGVAWVLTATPSVATPSVQEHLGDSVRGDVVLTDHSGARRTFADLLSQKRPTLLSFVYLRCTTLCPLTLAGLSRGLREAGLALGRDVDVMTVSIDPTDAPNALAERRTQLLRSLSHSPASSDWPFLSGDQLSLDTLTESIGYQSHLDAATHQYAHPAVTLVLSPRGNVSRYLYGLEQSARDLRLAVTEASDGRVGTSFDRALLTCFQFDAVRGRYGFSVGSFLRSGGMLVFLSVAGLLGVLWRREWARGRPHG